MLNTLAASTTLCPKHMKALQQNSSSLNNTAANSLHQHQDHSSHQMAQHSQHNLHDGMIMSFHGGYDEVILFDFWNTNKSIPLFVLSCVALFVMAMLYEGLKLAREKLIRRELLNRQSAGNVLPFSSSTCHCNKKSKKANQNGNGEANNLLSEQNGNVTSNGVEDEVAILSNSVKHECCSKKNNINQESHMTNNDNSREVTVKSYSSRLMSQGHVIQTLLHMLQITISYLLMLVFMTYNSWLCLSVVLGAGAGYFLFGLQRIASIDVNEHCH